MIGLRRMEADGYLIAFMLDGADGFCGVTERGELVVEGGEGFRELMFRALVDKCGPLERVFTAADFEVDPTEFGFEKFENYYAARGENLKLPRNCR